MGAGVALPRPKTKPWHEDDRFWEVAAPVLYPPERAQAARGEVDAIVRLLGLRPGMAVFDQGCGPGWHTLALARQGFVATGIDRTAAYLATAAGQSRTEGLATRFEHGDVRTFVKPGAFDAVISLYGALGLYEDPAEDRRVLANAFESLKPGGGLLLSLRTRQAIPVGVREEDFREEAGLDLLEERVLPAGTDRQAIHWVLYQGDDRYEFQLQVRLYEPAELAAVLTAVGFTEIRCYADWAGTPYDRGATRMVAIARKPEAAP